MTKRYCKRVLLPYVGVIQVLDLGWARALSVDGKTWSVRYQQHENHKTRMARLNYDPRVNIAIMISIEQDHMQSRTIRTDLEPGQTEIDCQRIFEALRSARIPFEAADHYEYWLLDAQDDNPLALLHTCVDENEVYSHTPAPVWHTIPAAELAIEDPLTEDDAVYQPPVNYRLQQLVETQAGRKPRAVWFKRTSGDTDNFPACLIKAQWDDPEVQRLCDLYLQRLAPRLLMLSGLPARLRERLEIDACKHAHEVESFHRLYPQVINENLLTAARVEARLRQANKHAKGN